MIKLFTVTVQKTNDERQVCCCCLLFTSELSEDRDLDDQTAVYRMLIIHTFERGDIISVLFKAAHL